MLAKRRLDISDYAALQGWDKSAQAGYLKLGKNRNLNDSQILEAIGNGYNVKVVDAILHWVFLCNWKHHRKLGATESDADSSS